jgi:hypothetical protein
MEIDTRALTILDQWELVSEGWTRRMELEVIVSGKVMPVVTHVLATEQVIDSVVPYDDPYTPLLDLSKVQEIGAVLRSIT